MLEHSGVQIKSGENFFVFSKYFFSWFALSEGVDYKDSEDFAEKVSELKEAYFPSDEVIAEETVVEEGTGEFSTESESVIDPTMNQYSDAISKLKPLG